jgi:hypothetical protein
MIRLGIIDFDTSHSIEFTRRFNHVGVDVEQFVDGARVVVGWPGSSEMSPERIPGFTEQIEACGVELVDAPADMLGRIDAVIVHSICGTGHLERVRPFLEAGIPAFVDKPFACSLEDAHRMIGLAREHNTVVYSTSALRFSEDVTEFERRLSDYGALRGIVCYGPAKRAAGNPGLFHYGIHTVEVLYALMGPGCEKLSTTFCEETEVITACWHDGRIATLRGNRQGSTAYGFLAFCERAVVHQPVSARYAYRNVCRSIVQTLETGQPTVPNEVTLELMQFILASLESERRSGEFVLLDSTG